ncbi:MAG: AbiV family abortive infection protein [Candidatus Lokiarchaeia archaeon]
MNVETWQKGIDISIGNVIQLYEDGKLLMENGSYGHACFSFITAFEEMGVAYFILKNYDTPKPQKLEKFLNHRKKLVIPNIISLFTTQEPFGYLSKLYELLLQSKNKINKTEVHKFSEEIQKAENLWYLRIHGIYVSLNNAKTNFLSPTHITKRHAESLKIKLEKAIPYLQVERDVYKKFGEPEQIDSENFEILIKTLSGLVECMEAFDEDSLEKINKLQNVTPELKDFFINMLLDNFPIKHEQLNLEIGEELNEQNIANIFMIGLFEFLKNFQDKLKPIFKSKRDKEIIKYRTERMKEYSPKESEMSEFMLSFLELVLNEDSDQEDLKKLFLE